MSRMNPFLIASDATLPPMARYLKKSQPEMSGSFGLRGGLSMMSRSGGLKPRAVAGSPSVTRFTHSSWTGISASGRPRMAVRKMLRRQSGSGEDRETETASCGGKAGWCGLKTNGVPLWTLLLEEQIQIFRKFTLQQPKIE